MLRRRRFKQIQSLEKRLADEAKRLREQAECFRPAGYAMPSKRKRNRRRRARIGWSGCDLQDYGLPSEQLHISLPIREMDARNDPALNVLRVCAEGEIGTR